MDEKKELNKEELRIVKYDRHFCDWESYVKSDVDIASKLLATIISFYNGSKPIFFTNHKAAEWFGCSLSGIKKAFTKLERLKLITRHYDGKKRTIRFYPGEYKNYATIFDIRVSKFYKEASIRSTKRRLIKNRLYSLVNAGKDRIKELKKKFNNFLNYQIKRAKFAIYKKYTNPENLILLKERSQAYIKGLIYSPPLEIPPDDVLDEETKKILDEFCSGIK